MTGADVEPVFKTERQRLLRGVLETVGFCAVLWVFFLDGPPDSRATVFLVGAGVVGAVSLLARTYDEGRWSAQREDSIAFRAAVGLAVFVAIWLTTGSVWESRLARPEVAWSGIGLAAGALTARVLLYATGEWRPGDSP